MSDLWGRTTGGLLAAFFADVGLLRGLYVGPGDVDHQRVLSLHRAIIERLKQFPGEISFVPTPPPTVGVWTSSSPPLKIGWSDVPSPCRLGLTIALGK